MTKPEIFVVIKGGVVQHVLSPIDLKVTVLDQDIEGCSFVSVIDGAQCDIQEPDCITDAGRLERVHRDMKGPMVER